MKDTNVYKMEPGKIEFVPTTGKTPHKCPVCEGRGTVPAEFYEERFSLPMHRTSEYPYRVKCKSCAGTGLVWS